MKFLAAAAVVLMLLAGCGMEPPRANTPESPGFGAGAYDEVKVITVNVNGNNVTCVTWSSVPGANSNTGGISCDWANAKPVENE